MNKQPTVKAPEHFIVFPGRIATGVSFGTNPPKNDAPVLIVLGENGLMCEDPEGNAIVHEAVVATIQKYRETGIDVVLFSYAEPKSIYNISRWLDGNNVKWLFSGMFLPGESSQVVSQGEFAIDMLNSFILDGKVILAVISGEEDVRQYCSEVGLEHHSPLELTLKAL